MKKKWAIGIGGCLVLVIVLGVYFSAMNYDSIGAYNEFGLAKAEKDGKFGYIDKNKKEVVPVVFDSVEDFTDSGLVVVTEGEASGVYRSDGMKVLPLEYQEVTVGGWNENGLAPVSLDGEVNFISQDGALAFESTEAGPMSLLEVQADGKKGYADQDGTVVLACEYDDLEVVSDNGDNALLLLDGSRNFMDASGALLYDEVGEEDEDGWLQVRDGAGYGYVSETNQTLIPAQYAALEKEGRNSAGYIRVAADGKLFLLDEEGALLYQDTKDFEENGLAAVQSGDGLWGYIDRDGEVAVACLYDEVETFNEYGLSRAKTGGHYGYVDAGGAEVIPCVYDELMEFNEQGFAMAREGQSVNFLSASGEKKFDTVGEFSDKGVAHAEKGGRQFFIDELGDRINESDYDAIHKLEENETEVEGFLTCNGIRYGLTDEAGNEIIPAEIDEEARKKELEKYSLLNGIQDELDELEELYTEASYVPKCQLKLPEIVTFDV